jgi:sirohydrochlorin ferrochelatase
MDDSTDANAHGGPGGLLADCHNLGIVVVDHGSQLDESNRQLLDIVQLFRDTTGIKNVHAAHMDLAEPDMKSAFRSCYRDGARRIVVCPFFLSPGRHWTHDIPRLASDAAASLPAVDYRVAAPLGVHTLLIQLMRLRVEECLVQKEDIGSP